MATSIKIFIRSIGNLMRVFPIEDKDNSVGGIVEQLCDLINSGEGIGRDHLLFYNVLNLYFIRIS